MVATPPVSPRDDAAVVDAQLPAASDAASAPLPATQLFCDGASRKRASDEHRVRAVPELPSPDRKERRVDRPRPSVAAKPSRGVALSSSLSSQTGDVVHEPPSVTPSPAQLLANKLAESAARSAARRQTKVNYLREHRRNINEKAIADGKKKNAE